MSFKDILADDMKNVILNTNEFAEAITYVPKAGDEKTINAIVERDLLAPIGSGGADTRHKIIEILIANDATKGVTSVNLNGDYVKVAEYVGHPVERYRIIEIVEVNSASWALRCVK